MHSNSSPTTLWMAHVLLLIQDIMVNFKCQLSWISRNYVENWQSLILVCVCEEISIRVSRLKGRYTINMYLKSYPVIFWMEPKDGGKVLMKHSILEEGVNIAMYLHSWCVYLGAMDPPSGLHACTETILATKPSPQSFLKLYEVFPSYKDV